ATHMGAERAAQAVLVVAVVDKAVPANVGLILADAGQTACAGNERVARDVPADENLRQTDPGPCVARLSLDELPEPPDILMELAKYEIGSIAAEVASRGVLFGRGQSVGSFQPRI